MSTKEIARDFFDKELYAIYLAAWEEWGEAAWKIVWRSGEILLKEIEPELGLELGERARADITSSLSRSAVAAIVRRRIEDILRRHPPGRGLTHPAGR